MTDNPSPIHTIFDHFRSMDHRAVLGISALGTLALLITTDGGLLESTITWRNRVFVDMTHMRLGLVIFSGLFGFLAGWLMAAKRSGLKAAILGVAFGFFVFLIIFDHGALGWGSSSLMAICAFFTGLSYWVKGRATELVQNFKEKIRERPTTLGSSELADYAHCEKGDVIDGSGVQLGTFPAPDGTTAQLTYNGDRHLITTAPTRGQKGVAAIIPNLLTYEGSVLVIDPKGENAMITADRRQAMGQDVHIIDPWGITGMETARFNPLDWLAAGDIDIGDNAMLLADAIVMMSGGNEQFWDEEAKFALIGRALFVATDKQEEGQRHLGRVRDLCLLDGDDLEKLHKRMLQSPLALVRNVGASGLLKEPKLLSNVMASLQAQTHFLDSPRLRDSLAVSDFDFADLKTKRMSVYLVLPADKLNSHGRWLRLLIQQALAVNARNIEHKPARSVLFILDEMPALGKLSMVEQAFGLMAGFGIQLWGICQDASQLKRIYGDGWETFISNAGVLQYFGSRDKLTAEYFSSLCGVTTVWNWSTALARAFGITNGVNGSSSETTTQTDTASGMQRKLIFPDELMRMPKGQQLLLIENLNPIIATKQPWFENPNLKDLGVNLHDAPSDEDKAA